MDSITVSKRILECPVCYEVPSGGIVICAAGHSICSGCARQLRQCAMCQRPMTSARNFILEDIIEEFHRANAPLINCENASEGCKHKGKSSQIKDHEKDCEFRRVHCAIYSCKSNSIKISAYFNHLCNEHRIQGDRSQFLGMFNSPGEYSGWYGCINSPSLDTEYFPHYLKYDGQVFLLFHRIRNGQMSWWIKLIGSDSLCANYRARILVESPKIEPSFSMGWRVPIYPLRAPTSVIHSDPDNGAFIATSKLRPAYSFDDYDGRKETYDWNCRVVLIRN